MFHCLCAFYNSCVTWQIYSKNNELYCHTKLLRISLDRFTHCRNKLSTWLFWQQLLELLHRQFVASSYSQLFDCNCQCSFGCSWTPNRFVCIPKSWKYITNLTDCCLVHSYIVLVFCSLFIVFLLQCWEKNSLCGKVKIGTKLPLRIWKINCSSLFFGTMLFCVSVLQGFPLLLHAAYRYTQLWAYAFTLLHH